MPVEISVERKGASIVVRFNGDLRHADAEAFRRDVQSQLCGTGESILFELEDFQVEDGPGLLAVLNLFRQLVSGGWEVTLRHCPQILAHNFYKAGLLTGPRAIRLEAMREEEPYN